MKKFIFLEDKGKAVIAIAIDSIGCVYPLANDDGPDDVVVCFKKGSEPHANLDDRSDATLNTMTFKIDIQMIFDQLKGE